jgi:hypothetical protein
MKKFAKNKPKKVKPLELPLYVKNKLYEQHEAIGSNCNVVVKAKVNNTTVEIDVPPKTTPGTMSVADSSSNGLGSESSQA